MTNKIEVVTDVAVGLFPSSRVASAHSRRTARATQMKHIFGRKPDAPAAGATSEENSNQPPPPQAYNVSRAGSDCVNGVYHLDQSQPDAAVYRGAGNAAGHWLYLLKDTWTIAKAEDDYYSVKADGGPRPPPSGWLLEENGVEPAPIVHAVALSSNAL